MNHAVASGHAVEYLDQIEAFDELNACEMPPRNALLLVGSSIFREWDSASQQLAPLPIVNRAFGGSRTWELLHYFERVVSPYQPRAVAVYCGGNDLNAGEGDAAIFGRLQEFSQRLSAELPASQLVLVSIIRAPEKAPYYAALDALNAKLQAFCAVTPNRTFANVNPAFLHNGAPRPELFREDELHLTPAGYEALGLALRPTLLAAWKNLKKS